MIGGTDDAQRGCAEDTDTPYKRHRYRNRHLYRYRVQGTGTVHTLIRIQHVMELPLR